MATRRPPGTPGKIVSWFRNFLRGKPLDEKPWLRTPAVLSTRSPDPPNLPDGYAHRLAANYYYSRDLRREVQPPIPVSSLMIRHLPEPDKDDSVSREEVAYPELTTPPVPGLGHQWTWRQS